LSRGEIPNPGDTLLFFYAPSGGNDPGFYGWAVILEWLEIHSHLYFRAVAPSDYLKMRPWWDDDARDVAEAIRGKMKQRTLWIVSDDLVRRVREGIKSWVHGCA
jgi:hypothetical protein